MKNLLVLLSLLVTTSGAFAVVGETKTIECLLQTESAGILLIPQLTRRQNGCLVGSVTSQVANYDHVEGHGMNDRINKIKLTFAKCENQMSLSVLYKGKTKTIRDSAEVSHLIEMGHTAKVNKRYTDNWFISCGANTIK